MNKLILFVSCIIFFNLVSAGLTIQTRDFHINKTINLDSSLVFQITNTENFKIFNISTDQSEITIPKTDLLPGEVKNITMTIQRNTDFDGNIKIFGFYYAQLGSLNETHIINVSYENGLSECDKTIIKKDKITWVNSVDDEVTLRNTDTNNDITTILEGENYTSNFDTPEVFRYQFLRRGFIIPNTQCTITVLDDTGLINNPEFDDFIYLDLNILYNPTSISTTFPTVSYAMNFNEELEDIFTIKNTGTEQARNIQFSSDWITFSLNNLNLNPGESKNIGYKINPSISSTNDTNKTYTKNISINGNFDKIIQPINIFINHAIIDEFDVYNLTVNEDIIKYLIKNYCEDNPDEDFCKPQVVYTNINESDNLFNVTLSEEQLLGLWDFTFEEARKDSEFQNFVKILFDNYNISISEMRKNQNLTSKDLNRLADQLEDYNSIWIFVIIVGMCLIGIGIVVYLIFNQVRKNKIEKYEKWK